MTNLDDLPITGIMESPPIAITAATQADVDEIDKVSGQDLTAATHVEVDGGAAVRFYGKLVAVCNEYGTATCLPGIDREQIERLLEAANEVWPRRYLERLKDPWNPDDPGVPMRVCHRCGYNEANHKQLEASGEVSGPPYHDGCCGDFLPVPEHLRF